jgi:hypothetical protein
MSKKMRHTTEFEQEVLQYLNELRDSGETNMFGAAPYVEAHFGMGRQEARGYTKMWMDNFQPSGEYHEVIDENQDTQISNQ